MKYLLILLVFPILSATECGDKKATTANGVETPKDSIPPCVMKLIDDAVKATPSSTPTRVDEYLYNGKTVYLFTAPCCDQYNTLYSETCIPVCAPTGGFTGKGDGKCPDFVSTAKFVKLIWQKPDK